MSKRRVAFLSICSAFWTTWQCVVLKLSWWDSNPHLMVNHRSNASLRHHSNNINRLRTDKHLFLCSNQLSYTLTLNRIKSGWARTTDRKSRSKFILRHCLIGIRSKSRRKRIRHVHYQRSKSYKRHCVCLKSKGNVCVSISEYREDKESNLTICQK